MKKVREKNFISAVVYVHNNAKIVEKFLPFLYDVLQNNFEHYEIICVNDSSEDNAADIIKKFSGNISNSLISIVDMGIYQGIELSMNAGVDVSIGDFVFEFDNLYVSYDEAFIMQLYNKSMAGNDIVVAAPRNPAGFHSKIFYKIYNANSTSTNIVTQDVCHIISRRAINRIQALDKKIAYRKAVYSRCGLICEHVFFDNSLLINKKQSSELSKIKKETAFEALILYTNTIQKISVFLTLSFFCFTFLIGMYAFFVYFSENKPVEGWTFTILFLSIAFSGVFIVLTIILKYMSVVLEIVFKKQKYIINSVEKITNN